jgi:hypothetical protein
VPTFPPELGAALDDSAAALRAATESLYAGESTLEEWAAGMADVVRLAHAAAAVAALGDEAHAGHVNSLVAPHAGHLENFVADVASDEPPTAARAADRAASFARLAAGTYLEALRGVASFAGGTTSAPEPFPPGDGLADPRRRVRDDGWEEVYDPASGTWVAGDQLDPDDLDGPDASFAFDPDQPRGQPGNRGQFGPGGGDAGAAVAAKTNARAAELTAGRRQKGRERRAAVRAKREAELTATLAQPPRVAGPAAQAIGPALGRLFPEGFAAEDAHALVGAPKGSVVGGYASEYTGGVNLTVDHPHVDHCSRSLSRNKAGELVMSNQMFFLKKANRGSGLGLQVFSGEVRTLAALGVDRIETCAGKGGIMNGYYTWPRLGYDAPLEDRFKKRLPESLKGAETVQDLMATPGGREYWKAKGYMGGMTFDLKPGSRSLSVLNDYLKSKGKAPVEVDAAKVDALKARRQEAGKASARRQGQEAEAKEQRQAMNSARAYWRGQAAEAGISPDVLDSKAGTAEQRMMVERRDNPDRVFGTDSPATIRHDAYRTAATDLIAARHARRMADPSLADVRDHYEREAEARGLDPARVRAAAAELAYPSPDGVYAVGRAYADAIKSLAGDKAGVASFALNPGQSRGQPGNAGEFGPGSGDDADARLEYSRRRDAAGAAVRAGKLAAVRRAEYEVENRIHGKQVVVFDRPAGGAYDDPHRRAVEGAVLALVRERRPSDGEPTPIYRPAERHGQATEFVGGRPGSGGGVRSRGFVAGAGDGVTVGTADGRRLIGVRPSDPPDYVRFKIHVGLGLKPPPALTERWAPVLREERATHKSASGVSFARESRPASPRVAAAVRRFWGRATASFARNTGPDLSGLEDDLLGLSRPELLEVLAEAAEESWEGDDASFSFHDQPRVPAGQPGGGRWAGGVSPGTTAARAAASDAVREFARGRGPHTAADAEALAGHLSRLTVAQIHTLKEEHGLKGSAPNKAALVAKLAERFRAARAAEYGLPEAPRPGKVYNAAPSELHVDPSRFQYKLGTDPSGVTAELKSVRTWNPDFAGVVSVWKDPADGKTYVVNGHHRHELATRLGAPDLAVRYVNARTATGARALGALVNIAEGRGTAVDAAKFMRDSGVGIGDMERHGVSVRGKVAEDAVALARLSDRAFGKLTLGTLDQSKALAVAKHLPDHALQDQLFGLLDKREDEGKDLSLRTIEEMAREMAATPTHTRKEASLFGDIESEESLFVPRNELKGHVRAELSKEVNDFLAVASERRAGRVAGAGNVLDVEKNRQIAEQAARVRNVFDTLVNRKGEISDAINDAAGKLAAAKTKRDRDAARSEAVNSVRDAVLREAGLGRPGTSEPGGAGKGAAGGGGGGPAERGAGAAQAPADAGRGGPGAAGLRPHPAKVAAALERYANRDKTAKGGGLFGGEDMQARQGFARLPDGAPVVFTEGEFAGRTGKIVRDTSGGTDRVVAEVDGRPGLVPVDYTTIEPLNAALSWRTEAAAAPLEQKSLLSAEHFLPRR